MLPRELYIDRLRVVLTVLVLLFHAAITYGGMGSWYYQEILPSPRPSIVFLFMFNCTLQAFFMAFFFLLAGYFTPASLRRKGYRKFLTDRLLRLGIPLLIFVLILGPLTVGLAAVGQGQPFWPTVYALFRHRQYVDGPLWFAQALLVFNFVYCAWHFGVSRLRKQPDPTALNSDTSTTNPTPLPPPAIWLLSALGVGLASFLIRLVYPPGVRFLGLWPADFAPYIFLFGVGVIASRTRGLSRFTAKQARTSIIAACVAWPVFPLAILLYVLAGNASKLGHGWSWPLVLQAFWEPFVAWGVIAAMLLWFRAHGNRPSVLWTWLSRRAFAVYIIHAPLLVAICLLLRSWHAGPLLKFATSGTLICLVAWLIADPLVRLPGVRAIL